MKRRQWQEIEAAAGLLEPGGGGHHGRHQGACHRLCRQGHPDGSGNTADEARMGRMTAACSVLGGCGERYLFP